MKEITKHLLHLYKKAGADNVILHAVDNENTSIKFSNNKISISKTKHLQAINIFVTKDKRVLSTSLKTLNNTAAKNLVRKSMQALKQIQASKDFSCIAKGPFKYRKSCYDPKIEDMDTEMTEIVAQSIDAIGKQRAEGVLERNFSKRYILTSNKVEAEDKGTSLYFSFRSMLNKQATGHQTAVGRSVKQFPFLEAAEHAAQIAREATRPKKSIEGKYTVIFEPYAFANLLDNVGSSASIFSVESGLSFFKDKEGQQVASKKLNVIDDGSMENGYGCTPFDAEGHPTKKTTLIKNGVFKNYLHNSSTAKKYKTKSTGNAGLISPEPHNTVILPGKKSKDQLFSSIRKGIYITNLFYTRFNNYSTGDFSSLPRDGTFMLKNGEIQHGLKSIRISDNLLRMLKAVQGIGNKQQQIMSWETSAPCTLPYIVIKDVNITKPN